MKPSFYIIITVAIVAILIVVLVIYNKNKKSKATAGTAILTADALALRKLQDQCETLFNTQAEVDACVAQKLAAA